jgi:putative serine protease PepD
MAEDDSRSGGVGGDASGRPPGGDRPDPSGWQAPPSDQRAGTGGDRPDPIGVGWWSSEDTQPMGGPSFAPPSGYHESPGQNPPVQGFAGGYPPAGFPPPSGVPLLAPRTPAQAAVAYPPPGVQQGHVPPAQTGSRGSSQPGRGPARAGVVVAVAALTALVIGGGAGYAGARLAERSAEQPATSSSTVAGRPGSSAGPSVSAGPSATRSPVAPAPGTLNAVEVAAAALPSTVMIRVGSGGDSSIGSGFVLDGSGLVMTNNHVVAAAADGERLRVVFSDGVQASASLVGRSPSYDIAVIRVRTSHVLVPMPIGDSDNTQVGEGVLAIGAPLGLPGTVTQGIVSARNRPVAVGSEGQNSNAYINGTQTDAPINPGNSGGPLLDAGGRVIGVNSAILTLGADRQTAGSIGLGFAIPINQAMQIGKMLIADGKATYPVIGADVADSGDLAGVRLTAVTAGGPADRAGLQTGDVVTKIDGRPVAAADELIVAVRSHRPGDQVTITVRRGGQTRDFRVTLGSREG